MKIDRDRARAAFAAYVAPYDPKNPRISLKVAHTYRVASLSDRIARAAGLAGEDVDLAWLCGLLHDVGRFEQVRRWDTFRDADSTSHARLGARELFCERKTLGRPDASSQLPRIRDYLDDASEDELIRTVIAVHSDLAIPETLDERTRAFANIVRDADKVDILRTVECDTPETILGCSAGTLLESAISPEATRAFDERRCMRRDERSQPADYLVSFACFAFELVYPESRRAMREQGFALRLLESPFGITEPFHKPATRAELARMADELRAWLGADDREATRTPEPI